MPDRDTDAARERLAAAQNALLSALVAGATPPGGFDRRRLEVQRRALLAKRAGVVAKVAPGLADILGEDLRPLFEAYARERPMTDGYRRDALDFAAHVLDRSGPDVAGRRVRLAAWLDEQRPSDPAPRGLLRRLTSAFRKKDR
ncbi:hypothetical protein GCM10018779_09460 [Streptomyces griseocarneus]|nr:hypothetical protein GCM10018779_09460 [Streptomyces griseocarneus]